MVHWKNHCNKIMIDRNVDTKVWFKVMEQVEDLHNHKAYPRNRYYLPPIS